jgi:hypothetical protein
VRKSGVGVVQGLAKDAERAGLTEAVTGLAVDGERLVGVLDGLVVPAERELDLGQRGMGVAFQHPVAGLAGQAEGLPGVFDRLVEPVEVPVGGGQADEGHRLLVPGVCRLRQPQRPSQQLQGGGRLAEAQPDRAERAQDAGLEQRAVDLAGDLQCLAGAVERVVEPTGIGVDRREVAQRVGLAAAATELLEARQGMAETVARLVEPPERVADLTEPANRYARIEPGSVDMDSAVVNWS